MFNLHESPYLLDKTSTDEVVTRLTSIEQRVALLRQQGTLTDKTVRDYYGDKRFEQVAESNAIEGSTLNVGETQLAVMKGITVTGHDPAYVRDAIALDRALTRVVELARPGSASTDIEQLLEIHGLLLGDRPSAGSFRNERIRISGSDHSPPKTGEAVRSAMCDWERWSQENGELPAPIRAAVLHAWLTHVHPFLDGNGRTSRAISNLELIRGGYPPIIIKRTERDRYIEALSESDHGGDLRSFLDLVFDKIDGALTGLEHSAKKKQGYDPVVALVQKRKAQNLKVWETGVTLLASMIELRLGARLEPLKGRVRVKIFENLLDLETYDELCAGRGVSGGWSFIVTISIPGFPFFEKLAYVQHRSGAMYSRLGQEGGPSLYWSGKNPSGFPKWKPDFDRSPFAVELTSQLGRGDAWIVRDAANGFLELATTDVADRLCDALLTQATKV
ncbi:Fic family protein [uncultured Brevundimonas sp.]|uniref:Fic family protein n=1 Tax=uncultured Brevundimonas sp. TaxID=213418 RepID=UPI0025EB95D6|nr:Fic family protein [uncultured Brevundimonas sp.]